MVLQGNCSVAVRSSLREFRLPCALSRMSGHPRPPRPFHRGPVAHLRAIRTADVSSTATEPEGNREELQPKWPTKIVAARSRPTLRAGVMPLLWGVGGWTEIMTVPRRVRGRVGAGNLQVWLTGESNEQPIPTPSAALASLHRRGNDSPSKDARWVPTRYACSDSAPRATRDTAYSPRLAGARTGRLRLCQSVCTIPTSKVIPTSPMSYLTGPVSHRKR